MSQVLAGRYDDVDISAHDVHQGDLLASTVDVGLRDVTVENPGHVHVGR